MTPPYQSDPHYHAAMLAADLREIITRLSTIRFSEGDAIHFLVPRAQTHLEAYQEHLCSIPPPFRS